MSPQTEKRALQAVMAVACLVPIVAGGAGMGLGSAMLGGGTVNMDSHFRYLSGLLFGIGVAFAATLPRIETQTSVIRVLTLIVVAGGVARAAGLIHAVPSGAMVAAFGMELVVTPGLCLWQGRVARRAFASLPDRQRG